MIRRNKILSGIIVAATCSNMLSSTVAFAQENKKSTDIMNMDAQKLDDIQNDVDIVLDLAGSNVIQATTEAAVTVTEVEEHNDEEVVIKEDEEIIDEIDRKINQEIKKELTVKEITTEEPVLKTGGVLQTIVKQVPDIVINDIPEFSDDDVGIQIASISELDNYGDEGTSTYSASSTYGYSALSSLKNGIEMQGAYSVILDYLTKVHNGNISIDSTVRSKTYYLQKINISEFKLTADEYMKVFTSIRNDHPEFFWLSNSTGYSSEENNGKSIIKYAIPTVDSQYKSKELRSAMKSKVESAIEKYMDEIKNCSNDYEKEFVLHNKIVDETIYDPNLDKDNENINNHSIVGVLVNNVGVCESYAKTMQLLLNLAGIENIYVVGIGAGGGHAWNQVRIDGEYYNLDVTWDDTNKYAFDGIRYDYFNSKDEYFNKRHTANKPDCSTGTKEYLYPIKECNSDEASYYSKSNITLKLAAVKEYDNEDEAMKKYFTDRIKSYLKYDIYELRFAGENSELASKMEQYFKNNIKSIIEDDNDLLNLYMDKCGGEISYSISELDNGEREIRVNLNSPNKVAVESIKMLDKLNFDTLNYSAHLIPEFNPITAYNKDEIVWESSDERVATVVNGTVTPVGEGNAKITASINDASAECMVTVKLAQEKELQEEVPVTELTIDMKDTMYGVGSTQQLKAILKPDNATNINVTWYSEDESIISIDKNGLATAKGIGSTYIYCLADETTMTTYSKYPITVEVVKPADKSKLQSLYDEHKDKILGNYTEESFNKFQEALNVAKQVLDNAQASQELVDNTYLDLENSIKELKDKSNNDNESGNQTPEQPEKPGDNEGEDQPGEGTPEPPAGDKGENRPGEEAPEKPEDNKGENKPEETPEVKPELPEDSTGGSGSENQPGEETPGKPGDNEGGDQPGEGNPEPPAGDEDGNTPGEEAPEKPEDNTGGNGLGDKPEVEIPGDKEEDKPEVEIPVNPVVKDELKKLYDEYKKISNSGYTASTWRVFEEALKEAALVLDNGNASKEEVDKMYGKLKASYDGLRKQSSGSSSSSSSSGSSSSSSNSSSSGSSNSTSVNENKNTVNSGQNSSGSSNNTVDTVKSISQSIGGQIISKENILTQNGNTVEVTKVMINNTSAYIVKADTTDVVSIKASENDKVYAFVKALGVYKEIDSKLVEGNAVFNAESGMNYIVSDSAAISNEVSEGWNKINDSWYIVNKNGTLATGWHNDNGTWYNLSNDGKMNTGWIKDNDGKWYMLSESGAMKTGWCNDNGKWYHLSESGSMNTGWIRDNNGKWYHLSEAGSMNTGWFKDNNGKWYYLNSDGSMASNQYVDGYWVNGNGEWV